MIQKQLIQLVLLLGTLACIGSAKKGFLKHPNGSDAPLNSPINKNVNIQTPVNVNINNYNLTQLVEDI
jgi:hypothetical protein